MQTLEAPARVTEHLSESEFVAVSVTGKILDRLDAAWKEYIDTEEAVLKNISQAMLGKLLQYSALVNASAATLAFVVDPRFRIDRVSDAEYCGALLRYPV